MLDENAHQSLENQWYEVFGNAIPWHCQSKKGVRAEAELLAQDAPVFFVVPFLRSPIGSHDPKKGAAYKCSGEILPLAGFRFKDKFVAPPDFSWCMVYTHEDYAMIRGPLFFRREWIIPPRDTRAEERRRW